ncbi:hypothetical protein ABT127_34655 [Streptomyces sp. NPDC001904]|uniref:DUF5983 family protein n=1 Tax=Streptomyces sp. NPDC001904 TaxID=3154531 RepID=UPI0033273683
MSASNAGSEGLPALWDASREPGAPAPSVRPFLDVSTAHPRPAVAHNLDLYLDASPTPHGWWVYAPQEATEQAVREDWPDELLPVVQLARSRGCAYVLFDADGPTYSTLPVFGH